MREWLARATWRGGEAGRLLEYGALMDRKWPVAPVSRMALGRMFGGEGPKLLRIGFETTAALLGLGGVL
jgi:hypothetical protein